MAVQPVPALVLASPFPTNADRVAGIFNAMSKAWADSENPMALSVREIAVVTYNNANEAFNFAAAASVSANSAQGFRDQAQTYANNAGSSAAVVGRWDKLVLGPKSTPPTVDNDGQPLLVGAEYYNTVLKARYSWTGAAWMVGTNVTAGVASVDGMTGTVVLDKGAFVYSRANKIPNASFAIGFDGWSTFSDTGRTDWVLQDIAQGLRAARLLNVQGVVALLSPYMPVVVGRNYQWTAETFLTGATGGQTRLYIEWYDASKVLISKVYGADLFYSAYPEDFANRKANLVSAVAPAGSVFARFIFWAGALTGPANVGFHRPKFQESAPTTNPPMLYSDEATVDLLGERAGARGQQTYTSSQTINKTIFGLATYVEVEMWDGGSSGGAAVSTIAASNERAGGGGGEYLRFVARVADLPSSIALVVGAGGAAVTATASGSAVLLNGNPGGATSFNGVSGPGGLLAASGDLGSSRQGLAGRNAGEGGGAGAASGLTSRRDTGPGGSSVYGGAGGGGSLSGTTAGGTSTFGGAGGLGVAASATGATASAGVAPGGAGGGIRFNSNTGTATSGAGARGEIRLRWW